MTLENAVRQVELAQAELRAVDMRAQGWADKQREQFDKQRLEPLKGAGSRLIAALRKADEQCQAAIRMMAD